MVIKVRQDLVQYRQIEILIFVHNREKMQNRKNMLKKIGRNTKIVMRVFSRNTTSQA